MRRIRLDDPNVHVNYQSDRRETRKKAPYFSLVLERGECPAGLIFLSEIAVGGRTPERIQASEYALDVVKGFFLSKAKELVIRDPTSLLRRLTAFVNRKLYQQSNEKGVEFHTDAMILAASEERLYAISTGDARAYIYHQGAVSELRGDKGAAINHLGRSEEAELSVASTEIALGDVVIFLSPALSEVFRPQEISVILQKEKDLDKATLIINTLAQRKGIEGELVSMAWEVRAAEPLREEEHPQEITAGKEEETPMETKVKPEGEEPVALIPETLIGQAEEEEEEPKQDEHIERIKKSWLGKWKGRRRE